MVLYLAISIGSFNWLLFNSLKALHHLGYTLYYNEITCNQSVEELWLKILKEDGKQENIIKRVCS